MADVLGERDLLLLGGGLLDLRHGLGDEFLGAEVGEDIRELDVLRHASGGEVGVELGEERGLLRGGGLAEAEEDEGVGAEEVVAALAVERGVVDAVERDHGGGLVLGLPGAGQRHDGGGRGGGVGLGEGALGPLRDGLVLDGGAGGEAEAAVGAREVGPGGVDGGRVLLQVEDLEGVALGTCLRSRIRLGLDRLGGLVAGVGDAVEPALDAAPADGAVEGAVVADREIGKGEGLAADELLEAGLVGGAVGLEMDGVELAERPVGDEEGILVLRRELRAVAEDHAGGRSGADVDDRAERVAVVIGPLGGAVAPAELRPADGVVHARGAIPRRVHVPLHVGVVGEDLPVAVEVDVVLVPEAGGDDLPLFPILVRPRDPAARGVDALHEALPVDAGEELVLAPDLGDAGAVVALGGARSGCRRRRRGIRRRGRGRRRGGPCSPPTSSNFLRSSTLSYLSSLSVSEIR